jgi:hypothetical protein
MTKPVPEMRPNPELANPVYENAPKGEADRVAAQATRPLRARSDGRAAELRAVLSRPWRRLLRGLAMR